MKTIPVSGMVITDKDKETMIYAISSGEISYGSYNRLASGRLATYDKLNFCHLVNSGSSANLLAMMAFTSKNMPKEYRVKKGDEIITVAASFPTTVAPIIQAGCVPVFVDIDDSYNIDVGQIYKAITPKTKGIFIAHTLGIPFDVVEIENICRKLGLFLIADNCDSLGTTCNNKPISVWGDVITHSFYPAHHITSGEGGAVLTNNIRIAKIIQSMRDWGRDCQCEPGHDNYCGHRFEGQYGELPANYDHKYVYSELGYNLKMTNIQAALLYSQLDNIVEWTEIRKSNFAILDEYLHEYSFPYILKDGIYTDYSPSYKGIPSWFGYPICLPTRMNRSRVIEKLNKQGVQTRLLFAGNILKQPMWRYKHRTIGDLPMTNRIMEQMFWIGCWHGLSEEDMLYSRDVVFNAIKEEE